MELVRMLGEYVRMARRRFWIIAIVSTIGIGLSAFFAYVLPPKYKVQARILVESQQIPADLARSTVTASAAERLQLIEQRLMTRENLFGLIEKLSLYRERPDMTVAEKIAELRVNTGIQPIALTGGRRRGSGELSAFIIRFWHNNPAQAANFVNELVTIVLEQNIESRARRANETLAFFTREEERLGQALSALEARILSFKIENDQALPESLEFRRQEMVRLGESDLELDRRALELEEQRAALELELNRLAITPPSAQSPEEQRLRELRSLLAQQRTVYAESHREIRALKARIAAVEQSMTVDGTEQTPETGTDTRALQQAAIQRQIGLLENQLALLGEQKLAIAERRGELEASILKTPNVEIELNSLQRQYSEMQEQFGVAARKRAEAETGEKLEVNQQAERFEVIENAIPPERPESPNRPKLLVMGSVVSLGLALGLAFLVEQMRPAIRSTWQLERTLDLRPIVAIPRIRTRRENLWRWTRRMAFLLIVGVGIPGSLYMVDQRVMPLQLVGQKVIEKAGLERVILMIEQRF